MKIKFSHQIFHNLAGYDSHLFIKQFGEENDDIKLITNTEEMYISFTKVLKYSGKVNDKTGRPIINKFELSFFDYFKILPSSIDKLSKNLEKEQFIESAKYFPKEYLNLLTRKLAYPYEYINCPEKLQETQLHPIGKFTAQ